MIRGFWQHGFPLPLIRVALWVNGISDRWDTITFVVDTGATHTSIHPADATRRLGMSPASLDSRNWPTSTASGGVGGSAYYLTNPARYALFHDDGTLPEIHDGSVDIAELTPHNPSIPSLLGWDVLQHYRVHVATDAIFLERR